MQNPTPMQARVAELIDGYYFKSPATKGDGARSSAQDFERARCELIGHLQQQLELVKDMPFAMFQQIRRHEADPDPVTRRAKAIEREIAGLRAMLDGRDPVQIALSTNVDIELGSLVDSDERVWVGRQGWGGTCVNYTAEGLILDVVPQDDIDPVHTASIPCDELQADDVQADDDVAPTPELRSRAG